MKCIGKANMSAFYIQMQYIKIRAVIAEKRNLVPLLSALVHSFIYRKVEECLVKC
jgi:hypothetical protein